MSRESGQQRSRAVAIDTAIRQATKPKQLPDVPSTLSETELARLYDVELPYEQVLDELERGGY